MPLAYSIFADIGNSRTKIAVSSSPSELWLNEQTVVRPDQFDLNGFRPAVWHLISVNSKRCQELLTWIHRFREGDKTNVLTRHNFQMPLNVHAPDRLGCDRIAAAYGAWTLNRRRAPLIVVNVGTAVTIDLVNSRGEFEGGVIFPGPYASFQSLYLSTDQLPELFSTEIPAAILGRSTQAAIISGVWQMQIGAIRHIVSHIKTDLNTTQVPVFLSGGGAEPLKELFAVEMKFAGNLVLQGMRAATTQP